MMPILKFFVLALALVLTQGCGTDLSESGPVELKELLERNSDSFKTDLKKISYFLTERDYRMCPSPFCGGFWVWNLNQKLTLCADGIYKPKCYVADIDWSALNLPPAQEQKLNQLAEVSLVITAAHIYPKPYPYFPDLSILVVHQAWTAATKQPPKGAFFRARSLGFVCIAYPCFNIRAFWLNTPKYKDVSGLDLMHVGASKEQIEQAYKELETGQLLLAGAIQPDNIKPTSNVVQPGLTLVASQFYLPVRSISIKP